MRSINLIESPEQVFRSSTDVVASCVVLEVLSKRRPPQLLLEEVNFIQEKNNASPHKPARVHDRVEKDETFHHAVLGL